MNIAERLRLTDNFGLTTGGVLLTVLGSATLLAAIVLAAALFGGRAVGRTTCHNWSTETGRPSKFVVLNFADAGSCLTLAPDGRWVKNTDVVQFVGGGKK